MGHSQVSGTSSSGHSAHHIRDPNETRCISYFSVHDLCVSPFQQTENRASDFLPYFTRLWKRGRKRRKKLFCMFTILHYVGQIPWETESEILRPSCECSLKVLLDNLWEGGKEEGNRTWQQKKLKDNAAAWNQLFSEGPLELSGPFRAVLEPGLCTPKSINHWIQQYQGGS